jgi:hypothetical protein
VTAGSTHRETFLAIKPQQLLVVHGHALPRQQDPEPPVAEALALRRQIPQLLLDSRRTLIAFRRTVFGSTSISL